jgi:hypothetical protein
MAQKAHKAPKARNEQAAALFHRAGNAGVAVAVDTRPKTIHSRRGRVNRQEVRAALRRGDF